jgi:hypothetical protein
MAGPETLRETTDFGAEASGEALRREVNCELRKDHLFSGRSLDLSTAVDSRKESPGVEPRRFCRCHGCHDSIPFNAQRMPNNPVFEPIILFEARHLE